MSCKSFLIAESLETIQIQTTMKKLNFYSKRLGLWFLTPLSEIFELYRGGQFFG